MIFLKEINNAVSIQPLSICFYEPSIFLIALFYLVPKIMLSLKPILINIYYGLYIIPIRIKQECGVIIRSIVGTKAGLSVAAKTRLDTRQVKSIDLCLSRGAEGKMAVCMSLAPFDQKAHLVTAVQAKTGSSVICPREFHMQWMEYGLVEALAVVKMHCLDFNVIDHGNSSTD